MLFSYLPLDIIHHILSYNGVVKLRNGKYIGQISKSDQRYELLRKIPRNINRWGRDWFAPNSMYKIYVNKHLTILIWIEHNTNQPEYNYRINNTLKSYYKPK